MLFSLEGKARRNFRHCNKHGDLTPAEILKRMDMSYNASVERQEGVWPGRYAEETEGER